MSSSAPKLGIEPSLISRKEVGILFTITSAVTAALTRLGVDYVLTGGSLLGAIRQKGVLFCDDDVDMAIIDHDGAYEKAKANLSAELGPDYQYTVRPWEGGDRVRFKHSTVFLDLFTIRRYSTLSDLEAILLRKRNGQPQGYDYVKGLLDRIIESAGGGRELFPCYHFDERKAVEMWPKEIYREEEMFPLDCTLDFGPLRGAKGPRCPVMLLKRAFGDDCFEVYFQSTSHKVSWQ